MEASNQNDADELVQLRQLANETAQLIAEAEARQGAAKSAAPAAPTEEREGDGGVAHAADDDSAAPQNDAVQVERERDRSR